MYITTRIFLASATIALCLPFFVSAATLQELHTQLAKLMAQLAALQGAAGTTSTLSTGNSCPYLTRNLTRGINGDDVRQLQIFLTERGYLSVGNATGYFGALTEDAVKRFQCSLMNLCAGSPSQNGYGQIGPKTREKISVACLNIVNASTANTKRAKEPECSLKVTPSTIVNGQSATLTWTGTNANSGKISPGVGIVAPSGFKSINVTKNTTFRGTFTGEAGSSNCKATLTVSAEDTTPADSCVLDGLAVPSGSSVLAFKTSSVSAGQCESQFRTCLSGSLTGSYQYSSCSDQAPACTIYTAPTCNGTIVNDGVDSAGCALPLRCVSLVNPPPPPPPSNSDIQSAKIAEVGHSLVNTTMPGYFVDIANKKGKDITLNVQITNGAPLEWQWDHHYEAMQDSGNPSFMDLRAGLASASPAHDVLVLTERVPLEATIQWHNSEAVAKQWRDLAVQYNPNARIYMYTTWTGYNNEYWPGIPTRAAWRSRTEVDGALFEDLVRDTNALISSGPEFQIIPGHRAMMALYDAIQSGAINWAPNGIDHFFADDIHLNSLGNYYIALVHYATIYKDSPEGVSVPSALSGSITATHARQLQEMAWTVVSQYSLSGV